MEFGNRDLIPGVGPWDRGNRDLSQLERHEDNCNRSRKIKGKVS